MRQPEFDDEYVLPPDEANAPAAQGVTAPEFDAWCERNKEDLAKRVIVTAADRLYDKTAEQICVASVIMYPEDCWTAWATMCNAEMIYDAKLQTLMRIFEAAMMTRGVACHLDVLNGLSQDKQPELWRLAFEIGRWAGVSIEPYCRAVAILYEQRKAAHDVELAMQDFYKATSFLDKQVALERMKAIVPPQLNPPTKAKSNQDLIAELYQEAIEGRQGGGGASTGLRSLDDPLGGGLHPGRMYVISARPKKGKSSLAMGIGLTMAQQGARVAYVSLEMSRKDMLRRAGAWLGKENTFRQATNVHQIGAIRDGYSKLSELDLHFWDTQVRKFTDLEEWLARLHSERQLGLIVVDYLTLLPGRGKERDDLDIGANCTACKLLSIAFACPVILVAQMNRQAEARGGNRYKLSDLRGSGQIEQDADAVIFAWNASNEQGYEPNYAELDVSANRHGPPKHFRVDWHGEFYEYRDSNGSLVGASKKDEHF